MLTTTCIPNFYHTQYSCWGQLLFATSNFYEDDNCIICRAHDDQLSASSDHTRWQIITGPTAMSSPNRTSYYILYMCSIFKPSSSVSCPSLHAPHKIEFFYFILFNSIPFQFGLWFIKAVSNRFILFTILLSVSIFSFFVICICILWDAKLNGKALQCNLQVLIQTTFTNPFTTIQKPR